MLRLKVWLVNTWKVTNWYNFSGVGIGNAWRQFLLMGGNIRSIPRSRALRVTRSVMNGWHVSGATFQ